MNLQTALVLSRKGLAGRSEEEQDLLMEFIQQTVINGDYATIYEIVKPHLQMCVRRVKERFNLFDTDDLTQDSYIVLTKVVDKYDASSSRFLYYFGKYFYYEYLNYCFMAYRHLYVEWTNSLDEYIDKRYSIEDHTLGSLFATRILNYLHSSIACGKKRDSKNRRQMLSYYFIDDIDVRTIAKIMHCTYHNVYEQLTRYLYSLSSLINKDPYRTLNVTTEVSHNGNKIRYSKVYDYTPL